MAKITDSEKASEAASDRPAGWSELVKEVTLSGLATLFMTEDSVRGYLKEKKLPKEIALLIVDGLSKKKEEFYNIIAKEFGQVVSKMDLGKEMGKFLEGHSVKLSATLSFEPKEGFRIKKEESV